MSKMFLLRYIFLFIFTETHILLNQLAQLQRAHQPTPLQHTQQILLSAQAQHIKMMQRPIVCTMVMEQVLR